MTALSNFTIFVDFTDFFYLVMNTPQLGHSLGLSKDTSTLISIRDSSIVDDASNGKDIAEVQVFEEASKDDEKKKASNKDGDRTKMLYERNYDVIPYSVYAAIFVIVLYLASK